MSFRFRSHAGVALILGSAMILVAAAWLTSGVATRSSSPSVAFVQSRFTLPSGWSAGAVTRTRVTKFQAATDTMTVHGPHSLSLQLTYIPGSPKSGERATSNGFLLDRQIACCLGNLV